VRQKGSRPWNHNAAGALKTVVAAALAADSGCITTRVLGDREAKLAWGRAMKDRKSAENAGTTEMTDPQPAGKRGKRSEAALSREIQAKIGQQLRAYYDGFIEPTPERFADLLRRLDEPGKESPE
jgi:hypothetical protein